MDGVILNCSFCSTLFLMCKSCYRGQRYCCKDCRGIARAEQCKKAGKTYRRSFLARQIAAFRQARFRARSKKVTHQSSLEVPNPIESNSLSLAVDPKPQSETSHCFVCKKIISFFHYSPELMRSVHVKSRGKDKNCDDVSQRPP
jgi:hypothetical protein